MVILFFLFLKVVPHYERPKTHIKSLLIATGKQALRYKQILLSQVTLYVGIEQLIIRALRGSQ